MRPRGLGSLLVVAGAAGFVYAATLTYDFVWDDPLLIRARLHLYNLPRLPELLLSDFFGDAREPSFFFRPLVILSFFLDLKTWGLYPTGFHLTNVLAHVVVAVGVARLTLRVTASEVAAAAAGLLFAAHPVHTESVAFISGRTDVLATLFALATVLAYAGWRESGQWHRAAGSLAAFALALGAKESAAIVPLLLVAYDAIVLRDLRTRAALARAVVRYAAYAPVLAAYLAVRRAAVPALIDPRAMVWADPLTRLLTSVKLAAWSAWLAILPYPTNLYYVVASDRWPPTPAWWLGLAFLTLLLGFTVLALRHVPSAGFGAAWFWISLVPVIGANLMPIPKALMADRFLYLPTVGSCLAFGVVAGRLLGVTALQRDIRLRRAPAAGLALVIVVYALLTLWRNEDWKDEYRLAYRIVETAPDAAIPRLNLGLTQIREGNIVAAHASLVRAVAALPDNPMALAALGLTEALVGNRDTALTEARRALELAPDDPQVLAFAAEVHGLRGEMEAAVPLLERSLRINPTQVSTAMNLALALHLLRRDDAAEAALERGIALNTRAHEADMLVDKITAEVSGTRRPARAREAWHRYITALRRFPDLTPRIQSELAYAESQLAKLPLP